MVHRAEILAPAGDRDAFLAALGSGADAVYLGLDSFNARSSAGNFKLEELESMTQLAHAHGAKIYLTVNVIVLDHEMQEVIELIDGAWARGIDAVIIQDLGLIRVLHEVLPEVRIHASTQMNIHEPESLRALKQFDVKRVTLAREMNIDEIRTMVAVGNEIGIEVEAFVHGAICICYSGQCFLSSYIGRRSANRGQCAQPCRLAYELVDIKGNVIKTQGRHLLSPKDLAGVGVLPELLETGVHSLKIEGRMKSAEYVTQAVTVYKDAMDEIVAGNEPMVEEEAFELLAETFSRGFNSAYLKSERGNEMMSYSRPNNRGVFVGRIARFEGPDAVIAFNKPVYQGDLLDIWTSKGRFTHTLSTMYANDELSRATKEATEVLVPLDKRASVGDRVFRVRSAEVKTQASDAIKRAEEARIYVDAKLIAKKGETLSLTISDAGALKKNSDNVDPADLPIEVTLTAGVVEAARTKEITRDEIVEHLDRLGGTYFEFNNIDIELDSGVGMGFSALHRIRREALEAFEVARFFDNKKREKKHPTLPALKRSNFLVKNALHAGKQINVDAVVAEFGGARAALNAGAAQAHINAFKLIEVEAEEGIVPVLPRVTHAHEFDTYLGIAERFGKAICSTLGQLKVCAERKIPAEAHWSLNTTNAYTVDALAKMGADFIWLSPELSGRQIKALARYAARPVGMAVAGLSEVMVMEHCVLMAMGPCAQNCMTCRRRETPVALKDAKGYHFRVITDDTGRSHLYNSVPLDLSDSFKEIVESGVEAVRVDLETALTSSVSAEVARVRAALMETLGGHPIERVSDNLTRGHFYRGIT